MQMKHLDRILKTSFEVPICNYYACRYGAEAKIIRRVGRYKKLSDELKEAGCPLFNGRNCEWLTAKLRRKAAKLDNQLDKMISFTSTEMSEIQRDELRLYIAQGDTWPCFIEKMKLYDYSLKCNVVWPTDAIAYRIFAQISKQKRKIYGMSLCAQCFEAGNHEGHDFSRFFSQAGGACDCGNMDVLSQAGIYANKRDKNTFSFCNRHGPGSVQPQVPPTNLVSLAEFIIPKLFVRLFLVFRGWRRNYQLMIQNRTRGVGASKESFCNSLIEKTTRIVHLIQDMIDSGAPLRDAVADILLDIQLYTYLSERNVEDDLRDIYNSCLKFNLCDDYTNLIHKDGRVDFSLDWRSRGLLMEDFESLELSKNGEITKFSFECLLDELIFWTVRLFFPQHIINMSLCLLSHIAYRLFLKDNHSDNQFVASNFQAFILYYFSLIQYLLQNRYGCQFFAIYPGIPGIMHDLCRSEKPPILHAISSRVIHISVQILSGDALCLAIDQKINVKRILLESVWNLLKCGTTYSLVTQAPEYFDLNVPPLSPNEAIFCWQIYSLETNQSIQKHAYWSTVSDMQNLFTHPKIVERFLDDDSCLEIYARLVSYLQGLNLNYRVVSGDHVEYDIAKPYRVVKEIKLSFMLEWEISAVMMFSCVKSFTAQTGHSYLKNYEWLQAIGMLSEQFKTPPFQLTYHIPLHRHFSAVVNRCIDIPELNYIAYEASADEEFLSKILLHPLKIQVGRAETSAGMWARNGNSARNQSYIYAQAHYCSAFLDCDISLIKFIASRINPEIFFQSLTSSFHLIECLAYLFFEKSDKALVISRLEWITPIIDGALRLLLEIVVIQWSLDIGDKFSIQNEIVAALAISDTTYSKLRSIIPEHGGRSSITPEIFDEVLDKVASYIQPDLGAHNQQGVYRLQPESWVHFFNPVFCRMRASAARDYNDAILRAEEANYFKKGSKAYSSERAILSRSSELRVNDHIWIPYQLPGNNDSCKQQPFLSGIKNLLITPTFFALMHEILLLTIKYEKLNDAPLQEFIISDEFHGSNHSNIIRNNQYASISSLYCGYHERANSETIEMDDRTRKFSFVVPPTQSLITTLLAHMERAIGAKAEDRDTALAQTLKKQLGKDPSKLNRISGYAVDYIGRLFCLLYHNCKAIRDFFDDLMNKSICDIQNEENSSGRSDLCMNSKDEKRQKAKRRQEALLAAQKRKNAQLIKKMMESEGLDESQMEAMDTTHGPSDIDEEYTCTICNDCTSLDWTKPIGLLVNLNFNYATEQSLPADEPHLTLIEAHQKMDGCRMNLKALQSLKHELLSSVADEKGLSDIYDLAGLQVRSCGHFAHLSTYLEDL
uniref:E3 ubiquitin-protein ligase n=1 Tax=Dracunculus medinensis TaxID=318479 RepID=A0A158Q4C7_DRAME